MKTCTSTTKQAKLPLNTEPKGKGKGKATQWDSDDDDDDDDAYVTSNDFTDTPERRSSVINGNDNGAFGEVGGDDDSEVYG